MIQIHSIEEIIMRKKICNSWHNDFTNNKIFDSKIKYNTITNTLFTLLYTRKCYICNQNQRTLIIYQKWR